MMGSTLSGTATSGPSGAGLDRLTRHFPNRDRLLDRLRDGLLDGLNNYRGIFLANPHRNLFRFSDDFSSSLLAWSQTANADGAEVKISYLCEHSVKVRIHPREFRR